MNPTAERDFKGVWIPKEVWLDERLTALEKIILAEVDSLDCGEEGCWASNEHISKFCQCSDWKVSVAISKLIKLGYLKVLSFDGRTRKLKSCLMVSQRQTLENPKADMGKAKESNIKSNTKSNTKNITSAAPPNLAGFDEFWALYPRKVAKTTASSAWKKLKPNEDTILQIMADVDRRLNGEWRGKDMTYIPHPSTYLNQRRWEDETEVNDRAKPARPVEEELDADQLRALEEVRRQGIIYG